MREFKDNARNFLKAYNSLCKAYDMGFYAEDYEGLKLSGGASYNDNFPEVSINETSIHSYDLKMYGD